MAGSLSACFRPQENTSATDCREMHVLYRFLKLGFNSFKIAVNKCQITLRCEPGGIHRKLDLLNVLSIPPYCPDGEILRIFNDE